MANIPVPSVPVNAASQDSTVLGVTPGGIVKRFVVSDMITPSAKSADLAAPTGSTLVGTILPVTGAVSTNVSVALGFRYNLWNFLTDAERADSMTGSPTIDVSAKINAAISAASAANKPLDAFGTYRVGAQKIVFTDNADFSEATFYVYGSPAIAVEISTASAANPTDVLSNKVIFLPRRMENKGKPGTGWAGQGIGVRTVNTYSCEIHTGNIVSFGIGFQETSYSRGNVYNTYYLGYLENNQVNLDLIPGNAGAWVNENVHIGGRLDHYSGEGTNVAGTRCIRINKATNAVNNHLFLKPSMEGNVAEYQVENGGAYNTIIQGRWESVSPKVLYTGDDVNQGTRNIILGGYQSGSIVFTYAGTTGGVNELVTPGGGYSSTNLGVKVQNQSSSSNPIQTFYEAGTRPETAAAGDWAVKHSAFYLQGKRQADAAERVRLEYLNGRIYFGAGAVAPTVYIGNIGASSLGTNAPFFPTTNGTLNSGDSTLRWNNTYSINFRPGDGTSIWTTGAGTPESVVTAPVGSLYARTNGSIGITLYIKESGAGSTGWSPVITNSSLNIASYALLRTFVGQVTTINVTGTGIAGTFIVDATDTTSADNGGTIIVDASGRRWKRIVNGPVDIRWFGADATGTADSATAIQNALNSGYKQIKAYAGTYKILSTLTLPINVSFEGDGIGASILDGSTATFASLTSGTHIRTSAGTYTALPALSADVTKGQTVITFASAPSLSRGDVLLIYNPTDSSWSGWRTYYRAGELVRVAKVSGTSVTLQSGLCDDYAASAVGMYRLDNASSVALRGFTLKGLSGTSGAVTGLTLNQCIDSSVRDVAVTGCSYAQLNINKCFDIQLSGLRLEEDFSADFGGDYGLVIANSHIVNVTGGYYAASRHGLTTGGDAVLGCVTNRHILITNAVFASTTSTGLDCHGNTEYFSVTNSIINGGCTIAGNNLLVQGNQFIGIPNTENGGVQLGCSELRGANIKISNNRFWANNFTVGNTRAKFINIGKGSSALSTNTYKGGNIEIDNNQIYWEIPSYNVNASAIAINNDSYAGTDPITASIRGNEIISSTGISAGVISCQISAGTAKPFEYVVMSDNTLSGFSLYLGTVTGYYSTKKFICKGNEIDSGANGPGILAYGTRDYVSISDNHLLRSSTSPIYVIGQSGFNCREVDVSNNTAIDCNLSTTGSASTDAGIVVYYADYATVRENQTGTFNELLGVSAVAGFIPGEIITGATSGATAIVMATYSTTRIGIGRSRVGTFTLSETITGTTSGATATITIVAGYTTNTRNSFNTVTNLQISNNNDLRLTTDTFATITNYLPGSRLSGSATYNPGTINSAAGATTTVTVTGAAVGDQATISFSNDLQGVQMTAYISAANTVSVRFQNQTGANVTLASGTLRAAVTKQ